MNRQQHLMIRAMEECCELGQRISKALVFGLHEVQPGQAAYLDYSRELGTLVDDCS